MAQQSFEGTWEEIIQHAPKLAGHRVRLTVLDQTPSPPAALIPGTSLADALKDYIGKFSSDQPTDNARRAEKIWGEYVVEKHRKRQRPQP